MSHCGMCSKAGSSAIFARFQSPMSHEIVRSLAPSAWPHSVPELCLLTLSSCSCLLKPTRAGRLVDAMWKILMDHCQHVTGRQQAASASKNQRRAKQQITKRSNVSLERPGPPQRVHQSNICSPSFRPSLSQNSHLVSLQNKTTGVISVGHRRRRHRHRQRHGAIRMGRAPTMARTTSMARTTRLAWMAGMGRMNRDFLNCKIYFANFYASQSMSLVVGHFAYRLKRMSRTRRSVKTEHLTGRSTHAYFSRCAPIQHSVSYFTFRPMHLHWLKAK